MRATERTLLLGMTMLLCACANEAETLNEVLAGGWLTDDTPPNPETSIYCYGAIGSGDCHAVPLEEEGGRLVGFQRPPPTVSVER